MDNLPAKREFEPIVAIPPLADEVHLANGQTISINRDNAEMVLHQNYSEMDHLLIRRMGKYALIFTDGTPLEEYLLSRGYKIVTEEYPNLNTQKVWIEYMMSRVDKEQEGLGHELDE